MSARSDLQARLDELRQLATAGSSLTQGEAWLLAHGGRVADLIDAADKTSREYTLWAEDANDGEYALWRRDDLINGLVSTRAAVAPLVEDQAP